MSRLLRTLSLGIALAVALVGAEPAARADARDDEILSLRDQLTALTERLAALEAERADAAQVRDLKRRVSDLEADGGGVVPGWVRNLRISGNADVNYLRGGDHSRAPDGRFAVENARLFFDADLSRGGGVAGLRLFDAATFHLEWDLVREAELKNRVGAAYIEFTRLFGRDWLNLRFGRMPIPFGEEYVRFHERRPDNPLISFSAIAPYNWDEGLVFWGSVLEDRVVYKFAIMDGDIDFNVNTDSEPSLTAKLSFRPVGWADLSVSWLHTGQLGSRNELGKSAMEFAFVHALPFGHGSSVPSFQNGVSIPDDPELEVDTLDAWELDATLRPWGVGRLWLSYGGYRVESGGASTYDRELRYWVIEGVLDLGPLATALGWSEGASLLDPFYLAVRYSAIGTFDSDEGYLLGFLNEGQQLGYNTKSVHVLSLGLGYRMNPWLVFKLEYSLFDVETVSGLPAEIASLAGSRNYLGLGFSAGF